jgi:hypothetical protein
MKREKMKSLFVLIVFCLMGCAAVTGEQSSLTENKKLTICTDPRPEVCTMEYRPVCGERKDGSHKTYSNGCNACSDHEVIGYIEGECKE